MKPPLKPPIRATSDVLAKEAQDWDNRVLTPKDFDLVANEDDEAICYGFRRAPRTIDELVKELGIKETTREDLLQQLEALRQRFSDEHQLHTADEINAAIKAGKFSCFNDLAESWIDATALLECLS